MTKLNTYGKLRPATLGALLALLLCMLPGILWAAKTWDGGGANELASNPTNWIGTVAPLVGDFVVLDTTSSKNMTWDLNLLVGSWTQAGYLGTVTVATVYGTAGFTNLAIIGDCIISNGVWTHSGPQATEVNRLSATIGGNLIVGPNGAINVMNKGYQTRSGPGQLPGDGSSSYGGHGWSGGPCYGSILAPTNIGSGGRESYGGGAIRMRVSGTIRNDGLICSDGGPSTYGGGSGGSIWLIAGRLIGERSGIIRANGSRATDTYRAAGGGRIALVVTNAGADFSLYAGSVLSFGGGGFAGAGGTIYKKRTADRPGRGIVLVDNNGLAAPDYTEVPPGSPGNVPGEANFCPFYLTNAAILRLTNTYTVGDIYLQPPNTWLNLGFNTLNVKTFEHKVGPGNATNVVNWGAIIWLIKGSSFKF